MQNRRGNELHGNTKVTIKSQVLENKSAKWHATMRLKVGKKVEISLSYDRATSGHIEGPFINQKCRMKRDDKTKVRPANRNKSMNYFVGIVLVIINEKFTH